jgi:hypothetical protein
LTAILLCVILLLWDCLKISQIISPRLFESFHLILSLFGCFSLIHIFKISSNSYLTACRDLSPLPIKWKVCFYCTCSSQVDCYTITYLSLPIFLPEMIILAVTIASSSIESMIVSIPLCPWVIMMRPSTSNHKHACRLQWYTIWWNSYDSNFLILSPAVVCLLVYWDQWYVTISAVIFNKTQ